MMYRIYKKTNKQTNKKQKQNKTKQNKKKMVTNEQRLTKYELCAGFCIELKHLKQARTLTLINKI